MPSTFVYTMLLAIKRKPKEMFRNSLMLITVFVVTASLLAGCGFGHENFRQDKGSFKEPDDFVIQINDMGLFWQPEIPRRALEVIARESAKTNTIVVLFIHGWHHNAAADNPNARDFANALKAVRYTLDDNRGGAGPYRKSREHLTNTGDVKVIGLYIGWRGRSLPSVLDYLTFWGRKAAAERVGQGDLREFLIRLNAIYKNRNAERIGNEKTPFLGVVGIGHSFGGQVLFKAVSDILENELVRATPYVSASNPFTPPGHPGLLNGFGDMVVLINPALEALQYQRIHTLSQRLNYTKYQTPILLVLSSKTDTARQFFFPIGRWMDSFFRPSFSKEQRELWTEALGEYEPQRTHTVDGLDSGGTLMPGFDPAVYTNDPCSIIDIDLTHMPAIGGVRLMPTRSRRVYNPFLVAHTDSKIVLDHTGIFGGPLRNFLNDYIAINEGKRILLRGSQNSCPNIEKK